MRMRKVCGPQYFVGDVHLSHHARRPFVSAFFPSVSSRSIVPPTRSSLLLYTGTRTRVYTRAYARTCVLSTRKSYVYHSTAAFPTSSLPSCPLSARPMILPYYLQCNVHLWGEGAVIDKKRWGIKATRASNLSTTLRII